MDPRWPRPEICTVYEFGIAIGSFYSLNEIRSGLLRIGMDMKVEHTTKIKSEVRYIGEAKKDAIAGSLSTLLSEGLTFFDADNNNASEEPFTSSACFYHASQEPSRTAKISEEILIVDGDDVEVNKIHMFQVTFRLNCLMMEELNNAKIAIEVTLERRGNTLSSKRVQFNLEDGVMFGARQLFFVENFLCSCEIIVFGGLMKVEQINPDTIFRLPTQEKKTALKKFNRMQSSSSTYTDNMDFDCMEKLIKAVTEIRSQLGRSKQKLESGLVDIMSTQFACCLKAEPLILKLNQEQQPHDVHSNICGPVRNDELQQWKSGWNDVADLSEMNLVIWKKIKETIVNVIPTCILLRKYHSDILLRVAKSFISTKRTLEQASSFVPAKNLAKIVEGKRMDIGIQLLSLQCEDLDGDEKSFPILLEETFHKSLNETSSQTARKIRESIEETAVKSINHYFEKSQRIENSDEHLIIMVHGLGGSHMDLRLYKFFMNLFLPQENLIFLMSNLGYQNYTEAEIRNGTLDKLGKLLVNEIDKFIRRSKFPPKKISFIGYSLGGLVVRAALKMLDYETYLSKLNVFVSISCPHLGVLYMSSQIRAAGAKLLSKLVPEVKELHLTDKEDPMESFLVKLSADSRLENFKCIILCGSEEDGIVPHHSTNIFLCKAAARDLSSRGQAYQSMLENLKCSLYHNHTCKVLRYSAFFGEGLSFIKGAHVAVIDNVCFVEKFVARICEYFKNT